MSGVGCMTESKSTTALLEECIQRMNEGDEFARSELLNMASDRMLRITRRIMQDFQGVARWEQTDDVFQNAAIRLYQSLSQVEIEDARHFFRLAALQIRRAIIDMARHYQGPQGLGANHHTQGGRSDQAATPAAYDPAEETHDPSKIAQWRDFHARVEQLPSEEREVFDLLWYHDLSQDEAASVLNVNVRTIRRRWRAARLQLHDVLIDDGSSDEISAANH